MVAHLLPKQVVAGSSPVSRSIFSSLECGNPPIVRWVLSLLTAIRAMLAVPQNQVETMIAQLHRALEYLHADNLPVRTGAMWTLGYAYQLQGNRAVAAQLDQINTPKQHQRVYAPTLSGAMLYAHRATGTDGYDRPQQVERNVKRTQPKTRSKRTDGLSDQGQGPSGSSMDRLV